MCFLEGRVFSWQPYRDHQSLDVDPDALPHLNLRPRSSVVCYPNTVLARNEMFRAHPVLCLIQLPCFGEWYLELESWALGMLIAAGLSLFPDPISGKNGGPDAACGVCARTCAYMCRRLHTRLPCVPNHMYIGIESRKLTLILPILIQ